MSSHAEFRDMIAPYALGALEQPESSAVEEHLAECAFCSNLAREASEVGHYLSYSAAYRVPPTGGLDRLLESIGRQPLPVPQHDARADQRRRPRWPAWLSAPVALPVAASLLLALSMAGWNMLLMGDLKADHEEMGALHDRLAQQSHLLVMVTSGSAVTRPLAGTALAPSAEVRLIMDSDTNSAMLMASRLPPLPAGEIYQVWWGRQGARMPAGKLTVDAQGDGECSLAVDSSVHSYDSAWITLEPASGGPLPNSPGVAKGTL